MTATLPGPVGGDVEEDQAAADSPLTTKEGWRRFVDAEPSPPAVLEAGTLAGMGAVQRAAYDEARIDYHASLPLVNTPVIRQVVTTSRLLIQLNRHQVSARRGVVVSGSSGTGKTTALSQLGRAHEPPSAVSSAVMSASPARCPDWPAGGMPPAGLGLPASTPRLRGRSPRACRLGW